MRLLILTIFTSLLIVVASGCEDSPQRAPGLSRGNGAGGNNNHGGNAIVHRPANNNNNNQNNQQPPLNVDNFQPTEDENPSIPETPSEPMPNEPDPAQPGFPTDAKMAKKTIPSEEENAIVETLQAKGANIRLIDGHVFSILLNKENSFNDTDCPDVAKLSTVEFLGLSGSAITDAGLDRLTGLQNVTSILLDNTSITDAGIASLQKMPKLAHISISRTSVTFRGKQQLHETFPSTLVTRNVLVAKAGTGMRPGMEPGMEPGTPGFEPGMEPGIDGEGPPVFRAGSPEEAVQKVVMSLAKGEAEGLADYITKDADKVLKTVRSNKVEDRRMDYFIQTFKRVQLLGKPKIVKDRCNVVLLNDANRSLVFSCVREDDLWKIQKFSTKKTIRKK